MDIIKYIQEYYGSEISAGKVLMAIGALMIAVSYIISITVEGQIGYGILFGMLPLAVFQLLAGLVILIKNTVKQNKINRDFANKQQFDLPSEVNQMARVVKRFNMTRHIQEAICFMSFITIFLGLAKIVGPVIIGLSVAVVLQSAIMIAFDLFAQRRAEEYHRRLKRLEN